MEDKPLERTDSADGAADGKATTGWAVVLLFVAPALALLGRCLFCRRSTASYRIRHMHYAHTGIVKHVLKIVYIIITYTMYLFLPSLEH